VCLRVSTCVCVCGCVHVWHMAHLLLSHCKRASKSSLVHLPRPLFSPKDTHNICCTRTHMACGYPHTHTHTDTVRRQLALTLPLSRCCALFCNPSANNNDDDDGGICYLSDFLKHNSIPIPPPPSTATSG